MVKFPRLALMSLLAIQGTFFRKLHFIHQYSSLQLKQYAVQSCKHKYNFTNVFCVRMYYGKSNFDPYITILCLPMQYSITWNYRSFMKHMMLWKKNQMIGIIHAAGSTLLPAWMPPLTEWRGARSANRRRGGCSHWQVPAVLPGKWHCLMQNQIHVMHWIWLEQTHWQNK